jgi:hypothetical protein
MILYDPANFIDGCRIDFMRFCKRCYVEFDEEEDLYINPVEDFEDILDDIGIDDVNDICPDCREELGVTVSLGGIDDQDHHNDYEDDEDNDDEE